ncbi:MAG: fumarylacetoacetate hydrolase family protein [Rhodospirillales bacterium]|nr:fumarylacetoacetate hydrolase family protein [Rhodospirillales bacterium]
MKLVRYGDHGSERPGMFDSSGQLRDLSSHVDDISGSHLSAATLDKIRALDTDSLPAVSGEPRLGPCVGSIGKLVAIGLNYSDHAAEAGMNVPPEPIVFMKATSSICGPTDPIEIPRTSDKTDWEIELGVVIGKRAKNISEAEAAQHIAGYCTVNDVSERAFQVERKGQWTKGKSHDTHGPIGPWMVTVDEVVDPQNLRLWCEVDGVMRQDGSTSTMVFGVHFLVAYLSEFMTLESGDIIATGTPPGVGLGMKPTPVYLKEGQRLRCGVEGLGEQDHVMVKN